MDFEKDAEQCIVNGLRQRRQEWLRAAYDAYAPALMGVISRIVANNEVAEAVLQETFVTVWEKIHIYEPARERFFSWCLGIARRQALQAAKALADETQENPEQTIAEAYLQPNKIIPLQEKRYDEKARCELPLQAQAVLELLYLRGLTCDEAAKALKLTPQEVRQVLKKAFALLKSGQPI
ncbi:RNA polymerase sigma factor [Pontibacter mangrovi]|uniref:Sigma-70 family RNA polymerase sigma factor n=1 Tax=Pontibacter mangrovi TaxID=2589816 RepID=A0A501W3E1_9BACT|nr:sigma-70 family RNA polymerase sigma factor [Pontibacter mangrovi]TPE42810.1 sigma-70 family RNA polymerase sigma factor [Pontibacter mangrovi]